VVEFNFKTLQQSCLHLMMEKWRNYIAKPK
jgi:hypothetical protein